MGLTQSKEYLLVKMNQAAEAEHKEASTKAVRLGKAAPAAPVPLQPVDLEYPKYLHKGWKATAKGGGHFEPAESRLVKSKAEHDELGAEWTDAPPKQEAPAKKEAAKKE